MENLIRVSDILVFDAKTKDEKKDFNIADVILSHKGYVSGIVISGKGLFGIKRYGILRGRAVIAVFNIPASDLPLNIVAVNT